MGGLARAAGSMSLFESTSPRVVIPTEEAEHLLQVITTAAEALGATIEGIDYLEGDPRIAKLARVLDELVDLIAYKDGPGLIALMDARVNRATIREAEDKDSVPPFILHLVREDLLDG